MKVKRFDFRPLESWEKERLPRVVRSKETHQITEQLFVEEIGRLLVRYSASSELQTRRLIRDLIDYCLRRCHDYCIQGGIGAHYVQKGLIGKKVFEHLIPNNALRDLLIAERLPVWHALNSPIVLISAENDAKLRRCGLVSSIKNLNRPFERYLEAGIVDEIVTHDGHSIDMATWTLENHYEMVCCERKPPT